MKTLNETTAKVAQAESEIMGIVLTYYFRQEPVVNDKSNQLFLFFFHLLRRPESLEYQALTH